MDTHGIGIGTSGDALVTSAAAVGEGVDVVCHDVQVWSLVCPLKEAFLVRDDVTDWVAGVCEKEHARSFGWFFWEVVEVDVNNFCTGHLEIWLELAVAWLGNEDDLARLAENEAESLDEERDSAAEHDLGCLGVNSEVIAVEAGDCLAEWGFIGSGTVCEVVLGHFWAIADDWEEVIVNEAVFGSAEIDDGGITSACMESFRKRRLFRLFEVLDKGRFAHLGV